MLKRSIAWVACFLLAWLIWTSLAGCYALRKSSGGGQTIFDSQRKIRAADVALPEGYRIEPVLTGLTFPTGVVFDEKGAAYVIESGYSYGEVWTVPRLLKVQPGDKSAVPVASGGKNGPWTSVTYHQGDFYVAEGGVLEGGRILRITPQGEISTLLSGMPSHGDHHTNAVTAGPDGWIYFCQGTATNSGVVGEDNAKFGWLKRYPEFHDIPCRDVVLTGANFEGRDALKEESGEKVVTGAFVPFGTKTRKGQAIPGSVPCSGAVMRIRPEGGQPELVAWGFRNPFGLAFSAEGRLFATSNEYDVRGSRPVFGAGDLMWEVREGEWYGWPDFHGAEALYQGERYKPPGQEIPRRLLEIHPGKPPQPVAVFAVHSSSNGFDFSRNPAFGHTGQAFVAQFGDEAPDTGKVLAPVGYKIVRVDVRTGMIEDFAVNRGKTNGPASRLGSGGLERPVAARFDPEGTSLYIVDFGVLMHHGQGAVPRTDTGVLWRITRTDTD